MKYIFKVDFSYGSSSQITGVLSAKFYDDNDNVTFGATKVRTTIGAGSPVITNLNDPSGSGFYYVTKQMGTGGTAKVEFQQNGGDWVEYGVFGLKPKSTACDSDLATLGGKVRGVLTLTNRNSIQSLVLESSNIGATVQVAHNIGGPLQTGFGGGSFNSFTSSWTGAELFAIHATQVQAAMNTGVAAPPTCDFTSTVKHPFEEPATPLSLGETHTNVTVNGGNDGAINLIVSDGSGNFSFNWGDGPTTQNRTNLFAGFYNVTVTDIDTSEVRSLGIVITEPDAIAPVTLSETHVNVTTNGGADGSIDISALNGVGPFTYLWGDGPITQDRTGLVAGIYSVVVTDTANGDQDSLTITITEPAEEISAFPNTIVQSSPINPIRFKEDEIGEDLPLENYNYCEQPTEEMTKPPIYEIFNIQDQTRLQFISDFEVNTLLKENIDTGVQEVLPLELTQDNLAPGPSFNASLQGLFFEGNPALKLRNNQAGSNPYPNPKIGDIITISDQPSYDGSYAIIGITKDAFEDSIWVNGPFVGNLPVTLKFIGEIRFNVYELPIIFGNWGIGNFKLSLSTSGQGVALKTKLISENISVKAFTPNTLLFTYSNNDNAYKVVWGTGIIMKKRHEGFFTKVVPSRDSTNFRNSNDNPAVLNAYVRNKEEYNVLELTWFSIQRLSLIYSCDNFFLNGKKMFVEELPETGQSDSRYLLSSHTLIAEQVGWLDEQNTHDIGDTSEASIVIGGDSEEVLGV